MSILTAGLAIAMMAAPAPAQSRPPRPATRPAAARIDETLRVALTELTQEVTAAQQRRRSFPRTEANYFLDKDVVVDQEGLLALLARQLHRDPRADGYIKWQLLSGVKAFDARFARPAIAALVAAPPILPIPASPRDMQPWDNRAASAKEGDIDRINDEFGAWYREFVERNAILLAYRENLLARIRVEDDWRPRFLQARIEELSQRATAGLDTWKAQGELFAEVTEWASTASPAAVKDMTGFVAEYAKRKPPDVYDRLVWSERSGHGVWRTRAAGLDQERLAGLLDTLKTVAAQP